jgi:hypothetical protein
MPSLYRDFITYEIRVEYGGFGIHSAEFELSKRHIEFYSDTANVLVTNRIAEAVKSMEKAEYGYKVTYDDKNDNENIYNFFLTSNRAIIERCLDKSFRKKVIIKKLLSLNVFLKSYREIVHCRYKPGGPDYKTAQESFNFLSNGQIAGNHIYTSSQGDEQVLEDV